MDCSTFAFDLHVLGTPPALILSQDQTLMLNLLVRPPTAACATACVRTQLANTRSFYDLLLRCCLSKVGWFRKARRPTPSLLILRRAVLSAFYPVFKEPGRAFPVRFEPLTVARTVVRGTLQSYDGSGSMSTLLPLFPMTKPSAVSALSVHDRLSGLALPAAPAGAPCATPFSAPDH